MELVCNLKWLVVFLCMSHYAVCDQLETSENSPHLSSLKLARSNDALKILDDSALDHKRSDKQADHSHPIMKQKITREKKDHSDLDFHLRLQSQLMQDLVNEVRDIKKATYFLAASAVKRAEIPYISGCNGTRNLESCLLPKLSKLYTDLSIPVRVIPAANYRPGWGRVEVFYDGDWTTVCDEGWRWANSKVVCRMLGYSDGSTLDSIFVEAGTGYQTMSKVQCNGDEDSIQECPFERPSSDCGHYKDAGVKCEI